MRDYDYEDAPVIIERRGGAGMLLLGVLVGAAAGLLLAPRSGAETQAEIGRAARRLRDEAEGRVAGARQAVSGRVDSVRGGVHDRFEAVRGAVESRAEAARGAVEAGRRAARDAREELRRRVDDAKAAYRARGGADGADGAAPPPPAAEVVVTEVSTETDAGDLA